MSESLFLFEKSISRASFAESRGLDLSYIMIINLSSFWKFTEETVNSWKG